MYDVPKFGVLLCAAFLITTCAPAQAGDCGAGTLERFFLPEDAAKIKTAFIGFQKALRENDLQQLTIFVDKSTRVVEVSDSAIQSREGGDWQRSLDRIFTPYVRAGVNTQRPECLIVDWGGGIALENGSVWFRRREDSSLKVQEIFTNKIKPDPEDDFPPPSQPTPAEDPVVIQGTVLGFDWTSSLFAPEGIYTPRFIVRVEKTLSGMALPNKVRVDFWAVKGQAEYTLPDEFYQPGHVWKLYLRDSSKSPADGRVCHSEAADTIDFVDASTQKIVDVHPTIAALDPAHKGLLSFVNLPCFEMHGLYLTEVKQ